MHEIVTNLHMHTLYSDGNLTHAQIAQAALRARIDAVIVTDHNVYVEGPEDYYTEGAQRTLMLVGEEIHDQTREPVGNHLLVIGARKELAGLAFDPKRLLEGVRQAGGLAFIAHPSDHPIPMLHIDGYPWQDWEVRGFNGLEIWNSFSEFGSRLKSWLHGLYYAYQPQRIARGPFPEDLRRWDELLTSGQKMVAVGGSDAHGIPVNLGPLKRVLFPYEFHFQTINNHLMLPAPLSGDLETDRAAILEAFRRGRSFVGYDLPASTRGFRFNAHGYDQNAGMGDEISAQRGVTLQIRLPQAAECRLVRQGEVVQAWANQQHCSYITSQPGAYRVEAYLNYQGERRGWIFSNPIYVRK